MVLENKGQTQTILIEEIYDVKVREFSFLKSAGLTVLIPIAAYLTLGIIVVILMGGGM